MLVRINQSIQDRSNRRGMIYACAVDAASACLSGDAFKWYIRLSLNMDGYRWRDNIPTEIVRELSDHGYVSVSGEDAEFYTMPKLPKGQSYLPKYPCPGTTTEENKILDVAIDQAYPARGTCGVDPKSVALVVYGNEDMGEYCRQVIVSNMNFWTRHAMERLGPQQQEPPHYEPPATYDNQGYSDMFVHVGADGRVQDEPEPEYENPDLPW